MLNVFNPAPASPAGAKLLFKMLRSPTTADPQIRIIQELADQVDQRYTSRTNGVNRLTALALRLEERAVKEIQNQFFEEGELIAMLDAQNGVLLDERSWGNKKLYLFGLEDAFELEGLGARHGCDYAAIESKIRALSDTAFFILHEELDRFWNERAFGGPAPEIEKFLEKYHVV